MKNINDIDDIDLQTDFFNSRTELIKWFVNEYKLQKEPIKSQLKELSNKIFGLGYLYKNRISEVD